MRRQVASWLQSLGPMRGRHRGRGRGPWGHHAHAEQHHGGDGQQHHHYSRPFSAAGRGDAGPSQQHTEQQPRQTLDWRPPPSAAALPPELRARVDAYVNKWGRLLSLELESEKRQRDVRLQQWGPDRLMREGLMIQELTARTQGSLFGKTIVSLTRAGHLLPFHKFRSGDLVTLCRTHPLRDRSFEGTVLDKGRKDIRLVMSEPPPGLTHGTWRLDEGVNLALYLRCVDALRSLYKGAPGSTQRRQQQHEQQQQPQGALAAAGEGDDDPDDVDGSEEEGWPGGAGPSGSGGAGPQDAHPQQHHHHAGAQGQGGRGGGGGERGGWGGRGRGGGRGGRGKRRHKALEEDDEDAQLPPGTHLLDVLLAPHPQSTAVPQGAAAGHLAAAAPRAAEPSPVMPPPLLRWAASAAGAGGGGSIGAASSGGGAGAGGGGGGDASADDVAPALVAGAAAKQEVALAGLNLSQVAAVALAMRHRVSVLQGPPGTGKTTTIARFLAMVVGKLPLPSAVDAAGAPSSAAAASAPLAAAAAAAQRQRREALGGPVLVCAQSNVAVDNLLEALSALGVRALRIGQPAKVRGELRGATLDARVERHPRQAEALELSGRLRAHRQRLPSLRGRDRGLGHRDANIMARELRDLQAAITQSVLEDADVICATCVGAGSELLQDVRFPLVVLDEGSQATEPECLIPLTKSSKGLFAVAEGQLPREREAPTWKHAAPATAGLLIQQRSTSCAQ